MAKKRQHPPAKAAVIRNRIQIDEQLEDESLRPDPDQPPLDTAPSRASIYSEWLNTSARPSVQSAWLNSPSPTEPDPTLPSAPEPVPDDSASPPARGRRSSQARRLKAGERLVLNLETMETSELPVPRQPIARGAPVGETGLGDAPTVKLDRERAMRAALSEGHTGKQDARRATINRDLPAGQPDAAGLILGMQTPSTGQRPAARRASAGPDPLPHGATAGRTPIPRPPTAGPALGTSGATAVRLPAIRRSTGAQPAISRQDTVINVPAAARTTGIPAGRGTPINSAVLIRGARSPKLSTHIVPRRLRPPSVAMQALVAITTVGVLLAVLTLSSPLGYGAAIRGTFQAYTNAIAWIPTPTATATPTPVPPPPAQFSYIPASPGTQAVIDDIKAVFGQYATGALNIARCESGYVPTARNPYPVGNSHAEGVFQILYPSTWDTTSYANQNPYDYDTNIHAAWEIFSRDGYSWREWECRPY